MLDNLFAHILDMTITGSMVISVVLLARLALKKMPKIFSFCLWAVVLLRLLCPVGISVPESPVPKAASVADTYSLADMDVSFNNAGAAAIDGIVCATNMNPQTYAVQIQRIPQTPQLGNAPIVTCSPWETWVLFGQYLWVAGMMSMVFLSWHKLLRLQRKLSEAAHLRQNIYLINGISTPFVMGLFRPKIYIPTGLTEQEQQYILLHEGHHIRRLDHVSKALGYVALCLHWFNLLVWIAFGLAGEDMEMSCDEAVIRRLGSHVRADYSQSLLRFSTGRATIAGAPLAFGEGDAGKRIRNLSKWKQPARWVMALTTVACVVLSVGCVVDGSDKEPTADSNAAVEVVCGDNAELIYNIRDISMDHNKDFYFHMPEYPDVRFQISGGSVYAQENGVWHRLLSAYEIYVADLDGDGKREFCGSISVGSGIIDHRLIVYSLVDDMRYCLHERFAYDYYFALEGDRLVVNRCRYNHKEPEMVGKLVLAERQLSFVSGETTVLGSRVSPHFNETMLESMIAKAWDYQNHGRYLRILSGGAADYYMNLPENDFSAALITEEVDGSVWLDFGRVQGMEAEARYLAVLHMLTSRYYANIEDIGYYIYQDPANPMQLFICTEIRDSAYRDIQSYYEALTSGQCQPHEDTYIVQLGSRAVYRWGESENLYRDGTQ